MNRLLLGLILICCHVWAIETNGYSKYILAPTGRNEFERFLERLKSILKTGDKSFGIPILDPFTAEQVPIKIDQAVLNLDMLFTDVDARNLSEYNVIKADFNKFALTLRMNLSWPLISASANYDVKGKISYFDVYGKGQIKVSTYGLASEMEIRLGLNGLYLKVKTVKTSLFLKALDFQVTGLFNNEQLSEFLSVVISDRMPQLITDYQVTITKNLNFLMEEKLNAFLYDKTLNDLLKLISGRVSRLSSVII